MIDVLNLKTGEKRIYSGLTPEQALVAAYEQGRGNYNTWTYADKTHEIIEGKHSLAIEDWCVLKRTHGK